MAVDGIGGMASIPKKISSIGTGLNNGIKIMKGGKLALEGTKVLEISVAGIGAVATSGARALEAGLGINNMIGNDSSNGSGGNTGNIGRDGLTKEQRKYYDDEIENASTDEAADKIRYERNKVSRENRDLKPYENYDKWYEDVLRIRKNSSQGRQAEQEARSALKDLDIDIENNNTGSVETYTDTNGVTTRPDGVGTDANGNKVIHEHKHFTTS